MNLGTHIHQFPSGRFGFVGNLPTVLAEIVPATTGDILGCRSFKDADGNLKAYRFPVYGTASEARKAAADAGVTLCSIPTCACRSIA